MNKQEALVEILSVCRSYEQPHEETRRTLPDEVHDCVLEAARNIDILVGKGFDGSPDVAYDRLREELLRIAGGALYLLVDEVDIVQPTPVNAVMVGKKPVQIHVSPTDTPAPRIVVAPPGRRRA